MISWRYIGQGWHDVWVADDARASISRHPHVDRGRYILRIETREIGRFDDVALARWKAENIIEGSKA